MSRNSGALHIQSMHYFTSTGYKVLYEKVLTTITALRDQQMMALGNGELCSLLPSMSTLQDKKYTRPQVQIQVAECFPR